MLTICFGICPDASLVLAYVRGFVDGEESYSLVLAVVLSSLGMESRLRYLVVADKGSAEKGNEEMPLRKFLFDDHVF